MVYTGYEQFALMPCQDQLEYYAGEEEESHALQPSFHRVVSLIDYEVTTKHPLQHTWTQWHWENDRNKSWTDMLIEVTSFNTVEDFFSVYYIIKPPSDLKIFNDYMVFKNGMRPMWEDDANKNGGRWIMLLEKASKYLVNKMWHDLLLCILGECFTHSDQICGVVINVRNKANKLALWTKDADSKQAILSIGHQMKQLLQLGDMEIQYQAHKDAMVQHGPNVNALYKL